MTRRVDLDPVPSEALDGIWERNERLAGAVEAVLDLIEQDPPDPRVKRRLFTNGMWAVPVVGGGEEWTLIWEEDPPGQPVVRLLADTTSS